MQKKLWIIFTFFIRTDAPKSTYKTSLSFNTELFGIITPFTSNTELLRILTALFSPIPRKIHL